MFMSSTNYGMKDNIEFLHDPKDCIEAYDNFDGVNDLIPSCVYAIAVYGNSEDKTSES